MSASQQRLPTVAGQIRTDSRLVQPGDIFVAYRGVTSDGHDYLKTAMDKGAALLVVEDQNAIRHVKTPSIVVNSGREAWAYLAAAAAGNPQKKLIKIGVTGTNGKTSTTWMASHLLTAAGVPTLMVGTTGAKLGARLFPTQHTTPDPSDLYPLLAEALELGAQAVAMEVSSHAIRQKKLAPMTFDCAVFTSFSRDHLDFHGSMAEYWDAKWELFTNMLNPEGQALVCDQVQAPKPISALPTAATLFYGFADNKPLFADSSIVSCTIDNASFDGCEVTIQLGDGNRCGHVPYIGRHAIENFVAALLCTTHVTKSIPPAETWSGLPDIPGRLQRIVRADGPTVVVDYAHTPDALEKTLEILTQLTTGQLICVFGCGGDRDRGKRPEMGQIAERLATKVYVTSDNPRSEDPQSIISDICRGMRDQHLAIREPDRALAIEKAILNAQRGDIICIAGKGHETYQIIGNQTVAFDDCVIAKNALQKRSE